MNNDNIEKLLADMRKLANDMCVKFHDDVEDRISEFANRLQAMTLREQTCLDCPVAHLRFPNVIAAPPSPSVPDDWRDELALIESVLKGYAPSIARNDALRTVRAMLTSAPNADDSWQPIETAPRDGTVILVWLEEPMLDSRVQVAMFHPNVTSIGGRFDFDAPKPTYWQPLPAAPKGVANLSMEPQGANHGCTVAFNVPASVPEGWMLFPVEAWKFLTGEGPLNGQSFGESAPGERSFWWRSYIREMLTDAPGVV